MNGVFVKHGQCFTDRKQVFELFEYFFIGRAHAFGHVVYPDINDVAFRPGCRALGRMVTEHDGVQARKYGLPESRGQLQAAVCRITAPGHAEYFVPALEHAQNDKAPQLHVTGESAVEVKRNSQEPVWRHSQRVHGSQ